MNRVPDEVIPRRNRDGQIMFFFSSKDSRRDNSDVLMNSVELYALVKKLEGGSFYRTFSPKLVYKEIVTVIVDMVDEILRVRTFLAHHFRVKTLPRYL